MKRLIPHDVTITSVNKLKCFVIPRGKLGEEGRKITNNLLKRFHYLGLAKQYGRKLILIWHDTVTIGEYDIPTTLLGIVIFTTPQTLWLPDRDKWIGWSDELRLKNLHRKVASEVRFLILPHIQVPNLASKMLALSCKIARREWKKRYGDNLVLITCYSDPRLYKGHSYFGAGFKLIGHTKDGKRILAKPLKHYWKKELNR